MGEISENIKATFSNIIRIYEETASLFLDVDDLMVRNGFRLAKGTGIESAHSRSLNYPRWWMAFAGARYYISEADPMVAKSMGVIFLDSRMEPMDPVIVFATMKGSSEDSEEEVNPSGVLHEAWMKGIKDQSMEADHPFAKTRDVEQGKIKGILLEKVTDRSSLEELVINPLLEMDWK